MLSPIFLIDKAMLQGFSKSLFGLLQQCNLAKLTLGQLTLYTQRKETTFFLYHLFQPTLNANIPFKINI